MFRGSIQILRWSPFPLLWPCLSLCGEELGGCRSGKRVWSQGGELADVSSVDRGPDLGFPSPRPFPGTPLLLCVVASRLWPAFPAFRDVQMSRSWQSLPLLYCVSRTRTSVEPACPPEARRLQLHTGSWAEWCPGEAGRSWAPRSVVEVQGEGDPPPPTETARFGLQIGPVSQWDSVCLDDRVRVCLSRAELGREVPGGIGV